VFSDNTIGVVSSNTEYSTVSIFVPRGLTTQNNQQRIYIGGTSQIRVLDTNTNTVSSIGSLGSGSYNSIYNDVDNTMYFSLYAANQVKVYDFSTNTIIATINVGIEPSDMSFNPVLNRIYVLNETDNTVSVINCNTNTVIATITGMTNVLSILYIPNTTKLLVSNLNGIVYKINCSNNKITCSQDLGNNIPNMVYNPNDRFVYVSDYTTTTIRRFIP
jgi:YVTN family beta-propeller protein